MATIQEIDAEIARRKRNAEIDAMIAAKKQQAESNVDVPTPENLAAEDARVAARVDPSFADTAIGLGEAALTTATGATGGALGYLAGTVEGAAKELTGQIPRGGMEDIIQERSSALTFAPRTEEGQRIVKGIGDTLGALPPILGTTPLTTLRPLVAGSLVTERLLRNPRAKRALLAEQIRKGNPNIDLVTQMLDESGNLIKNKNAIKAVDILGGDVKAKQTVSVIENMDSASKMQVGKMLDIVEKMRREPIPKLGDMTRPSDILGDSISNRARALVHINKKAGETIGLEAKKLKNTMIDMSDARNDFFREMQDLGVNFEQIDGRIKVDFTDSTFVGGGADKIERIANAIKTGEMDGLSAHRQKQFIRDLVSFGKGTEGAISSRSQGIFKRLSSGIDEVLDNTSADYKKANDSYAKTIDFVEKFDKLAGKDIDIFSDMSKKALGGKAQRLASNAESRVPIEQLLMEADKTLADFNIRFKDDIPSLSHTVTHLEDIFKLEPANSFQGRIERGAANVAQGQSLTGATATSAIDIIKDIKQPDFEKKMRSLRLLTQPRK